MSLETSRLWHYGQNGKTSCDENTKSISKLESKTKFLITLYESDVVNSERSGVKMEFQWGCVVVSIIHQNASQNFLKSSSLSFVTVTFYNSSCFLLFETVMQLEREDVDVRVQGASFSLSVVSSGPSFRIDLLLMPEHHRGRLTKWLRWLQLLDRLLHLQTGSLFYISDGAGTVMGRPQG